MPALRSRAIRRAIFAGSVGGRPSRTPCERLTANASRMRSPIGRTPPEVMDQLGHTDPKLALRIYARSMRRDGGEVERLRALVGVSEWGSKGQK